MIFALLFSLVSFAQIEGHWLSEKGSGIIEVYKKEDGKFYGKLVATKTNPETKGLDIHNPDEKLRGRKVRGLEILKDFTQDSETKFTDGTIYDPKSGKTYSCKMTLDGDKLNIRGYVGITWFGRTSVWSRYTEKLPPGGEIK